MQYLHEPHTQNSGLNDDEIVNLNLAGRVRKSPVLDIRAARSHRPVRCVDSAFGP